jgi:hypothetical protein
VPLAPSDGHIVDNDIFGTSQGGIFEKQKKGCPEVGFWGGSCGCPEYFPADNLTERRCRMKNNAAEGNRQLQTQGTKKESGR